MLPSVPCSHSHERRPLRAPEARVPSRDACRACLPEPLFPLPSSVERPGSWWTSLFQVGRVRENAAALAGRPGGTSTPGRRARASLVWGAPRDGESSRGAGTGQSCRFILHWCKSELRGTQASFHACPLTRRERRRAQRLRAIETRDASLTDVSALKALEQREKAALAAMLTLKAQTEYQDNSHSSLHERDLLKTGGRGDNARAHKRCHVCSSHNLELTLCREMGILAPVSRYRLPHSSAAHSGRINRAHRERIVDIAVRRGLFRNYAQPRLPVLLRFCTCHACRRKRVRHKLRHKLRRQHRKRGDLPGARAARAIRMCMSSCLFMYF